jgi:hypothetical protein
VKTSSDHRACQGGPDVASDPSSPASPVSQSPPSGRNPPAPLIALSQVTPEPLRWLSPGRLAAGKITILDGDPGLGKSTLLCEFAARISRGDPLPGGEAAPPRLVVIMSAEDDLYDTIRPRIDAAGGDPRRVIAFAALSGQAALGTLGAIPDDVDILETIIARTEAALLVIDPLVAFLARGHTTEAAVASASSAPPAAASSSPPIPMIPSAAFWPLPKTTSGAHRPRWPSACWPHPGVMSRASSGTARASGPPGSCCASPPRAFPRTRSWPRLKSGCAPRSPRVPARPDRSCARQPTPASAAISSMPPENSKASPSARSGWLAATGSGRTLLAPANLPLFLIPGKFGKFGKFDSMARDRAVRTTYLPSLSALPFDRTNPAPPTSVQLSRAARKTARLRPRRAIRRPGSRASPFAVGL